LEPIKGVPLKLKSFERFLSTYPEWIGKVVLLQLIVPPSYSLLAEYETLASQVNDLAAKINSRYGDLQYQPVHCYFHNASSEELQALYTLADAALITPVSFFS
jgi:trehalose 6-phosphate synthase